MKAFLVALLALAGSADAYAYVSAAGNDPRVGGYDVETKSVLKSTEDGYSDAVAKGQGLYYSEDELEGAYIVSRYYSGAGNDAASAKLTACIAQKPAASDNVGIFPCATKGYLDYGVYDATAPILKGGYLCVGTAASVKGKLIACDTSVVSPFMSLEEKMSGTGTDLKVLIQAR